MKDFRLEKSEVLGVWIVFKRIGTSGWEEFHREKKKKDLMKWLEKQNLVKKKAYLTKEKEI